MELIEITYGNQSGKDSSNPEDKCAFIKRALGCEGMIICAQKKDGTGWLIMGNFLSLEHIQIVLGQDEMFRKGRADYRVVELEETQIGAPYSTAAEIQILEEFMMEGLGQDL